MPELSLSRGRAGVNPTVAGGFHGPCRDLAVLPGTLQNEPPYSPGGQPAEPAASPTESLTPNRKEVQWHDQSRSGSSYPRWNT